MPSTHPTTSQPPHASGLNLLRMPPESLRPFATASGRRYERTGEREIESLAAAIRVTRGVQWTPVRIRDYSLLGFGVVPAHPSQALPLDARTLELKVNGPWGRELVLPCEVMNAPTAAEGHRLGLRRLDLLDAPPAGNEAPYALQAHSRLEVRVENPVLYQEWSSASLVGFGTRREWVFRSADSGLLLLKELPLRIQFDLPLESDGICEGEILWAGVVPGTDGLTFGIKWLDMPFEVSNGLGETLLRTEGCRPAQLRPYGVLLRRFREQLRFTVVSTREDYQKVLDLRKQAYILAGKVPPETTADQLASRFDDRSRILAAFHGDEVAACLGLTFPKDESSPLRSEVLFPGRKYPVQVPPKAKLIEAHAFCTRPEYRGGDLVKGVFEQVARCLLLSDREWILTLATQDLWPLYRRIGFRKAGASVKVDFLGGIEHHLILLHRDAWASGKGLSPFEWNHFYGDLVRELVDRGYLELGLSARLRVGLLGLFRGMARRMADDRLENEFREFLRKDSPKEKDGD